MISLSRSFSFRPRFSAPKSDPSSETVERSVEVFPFSALEDYLRQQLLDVHKCQRRQAASSHKTSSTVHAAPDLVSVASTVANPSSLPPTGDVGTGRTTGVPDVSSFEWVAVEEEQQAQAKIQNFRGRQWLQRAVTEQRHERLRRSARLGFGIVAIAIAIVSALWILDDPFGFKVVLGQSTKMFF